MQVKVTSMVPVHDDIKGHGARVGFTVDHGEGHTTDHLATVYGDPKDAAAEAWDFVETGLAHDEAVREQARVLTTGIFQTKAEKAAEHRAKVAAEHKADALAEKAEAAAKEAEAKKVEHLNVTPKTEAHLNVPPSSTGTFGHVSPQPERAPYPWEHEKKDK